MKSPVVYLLTKANGVSCVLFHVEHSAGDEWCWRWRITGPYPQRYKEWREGSSLDSRQIFQPEIAFCGIEAQWRKPGTSRWRKAALREAAIGSSSFYIRAKQDFSAPQGFQVIARLPGDVIACYCFEPLFLAAGVETTLRGVAEGAFADNVLMREGEFMVEDTFVEICNTRASRGSLVASADPAPRLGVAEGGAERRLFSHQSAEPGVVRALIEDSSLN